MYLVRQFTNMSIKNFLKNIPKDSIFPVGNEVGKHISGIYGFYNENDNIHKQVKPLLDFHLNTLKKFNASYDDRRIFIENRDLILEKKDMVFEGKIHQDSMNDEGDSCWTCVYYYNIESTIIGGELEFPPFVKYKPKEDDIIYFDGDWKHKIGKTTGFGIRGTLIFNIKKNNFIY
jgi:hypothetical protein